MFSMMRRKCFWHFARTTVLNYANYNDIWPVRGADLFDVLWVTIQTNEHTSHQETLGLVHQRLAQASANGEMSSALLDMDECTDLLDRTDVDVVKKQKKKRGC